MSNAQNSVSLVMIVRNEAHQLGECLAPVADLFHEIVIVDTGSTDRTVEIARGYTPHVIPFAWCDDFSAARNESLHHARGEWVFWLDADDRVQPNQVQGLRNLLNACGQEPRAYLLNTICEGTEPGEPGHLITHPRLFRRHPKLRWEGRVHEQLRPWPATLGYEICCSDIQIEHVGYRDLAIHQRKLLRDVRLLRMDHAVDPTEASTLLHLGQAYAQLGRAGEARKYLQQLLHLSQRPFDHLRRVFVTLAKLAIRESNFVEAAQISQSALQAYPDDDHLALILAEALYEMDRYDDSGRILSAIISRPTVVAYQAGSPSEIKTLLAPRSLGEVLRIQGRLEAAERVLIAVVKAHPHDTVAWHALGRVYIDQRRPDKVAEAAQRLNGCPKGHSFSLLLMAAWHLVRGDAARSEESLHELIGCEPNMAVARLMRAECLTRRNAPRGERRQAYRDVLRIEPANVTAVTRLKHLEAEELRPTGVAPAVVGSLSYLAMA